MIGPLETLYTPGHTPGCVCFYWRERGIVAVGDAILTWPKLGGGWPGFNLDEAPLPAVAAAARRARAADRPARATAPRSPTTRRNVISAVSPSS